MRALILNVATTMDGYIAGPNGEYDWCFVDQDYGMSAFLRRVDATIMGRKTYDVMMRTDGKPYDVQMNFVITHRRKRLKPDNVTFVSAEIPSFVRTLKRKSGRDIWLVGGAEIVNQLLPAGLVDEMMLALHPVLLGKGTPLFTQTARRLNYKLKNQKQYSTGLVQLHYRKR